MSQITMRRLYAWIIFVIISISIPVCPAWAATDARMMRYPDVSKDKIVFTYASDLWIVPITGGQAIRLTSDNDTTVRGIEKRAKFSPDGTEVAYSAIYRGNKDIYRLPVGGGIPYRVTYHPAPDILLDWAADGQQLLFASNMISERTRYNKLFMVDKTGGMPEQLPLAYGETAALSENKQQIIYTVKKDFQEESWKRYHGGRAPDLWFLDRKSGKSTKLTDFDGPDSYPMWAGSDVYYLSEEGESERSNLWRINLTSKQKVQITHFTDYDVRYPSIGPDHIIFQQGADLWLLELSDQKMRKLTVDLILDHNSLRPSLQSVKDQISDIIATQDGVTAYVQARGEIFAMAVKHQTTHNITQSSGVAERYPSPSPDGKYIAYFSDENGEYQLHIRDLDNQKIRVLTKFEKGYRYRPQWSPDGKKIVFVDSEQRLRLMDVKTSDMTVIDKGLWRDHYDLQKMAVSWSSDSRWLTFSRHMENLNQALFLYEVKPKKLHQITSGSYNDYHPLFDPEGNYLYFLSQRQFSPTFGDIDFTWTYSHSTVIAMVPLRKDLLSPFDMSWARPDRQKTVNIDVEDMANRVIILPLNSGSFDHLIAADGKIIYRTVSSRSTGNKASNDLRVYDFEEKKELTILVDVRSAQYLPDSDKILVQQKNQYGFVSPAENQDMQDILNMDNLQMVIDHKAEYGQILTESLRYMRDFFYDPGLHGVNWQDVGDSYKKLLPHVSTSEDMSFILRELAGEVAGGHVWATASGRGRMPNKTVGLLGVDFEISDNRYKIRKIYSGGDYANAPRSPLAAPGLNVQAGDYLLAVNDVELSVENDPWQYFENQLGKTVKLTIAASVQGKKRRDIFVKTIGNEQKLRELDWVEANRQKVLAASQGKIGYIYLPDTALNGQNDMMRQYRAQYHKNGLIIDERFNTGGALGDRLVELLNRPALNYFSNRDGLDYALPTIGHNGPKALLTNGWSYSGGDGFPLLFKAAKLGPLIGTRTWGGLIGPNLGLPLITGGAISAPPQRVFDLQGQWAEGNEGVRPHITVENDPSRLFLGHDYQLDRAIHEVSKSLKIFPARKTPAYTSGHEKEEQ